jgi:hypothetical protein
VHHSSYYRPLTTIVRHLRQCSCVDQSFCAITSKFITTRTKAGRLPQKMSYYCDPCNRDFHTWIGLKEHYVQSPDHHYCQYCNIHLDSASQLQSHYEVEHGYCHLCERAFKSDIGLHQHNQQKHASVYCFLCKRLFLSPSNYQSVSFTPFLELHMT